MLKLSTGAHWVDQWTRRQRDARLLCLIPIHMSCHDPNREMAASVEAAAPRDAMGGSDEGEWDGAAEEEVMVLVDLPEFGGVDLFEGARRIEIRVRALHVHVCDVVLNFGYCGGRAEGGRGRGYSNLPQSIDAPPYNRRPTTWITLTEPGGAGARGRGSRGAGAGRHATVRGAVRGPAGHDVGGGRAWQGRGRTRGGYVCVGFYGC